MFVTKWNFEPIPQTLYDDKDIVETAGYVPRQKTIENLLLCGQRLVESRMDEYDGRTVEEAEKNAPYCRVADLGLDESINLVNKLSDEAKASEANTRGGVSMPLENGNKSESETPDLSKEG